RPIEGRCAEDLYLACALARGDAAALAELEAVVIPAAERGLRLADDARREVMQILREKMLVRGGIASYDGRAPLAIWLRVCAARLALRATLGVTEAELDSIMRALASVAEVTLRTVLARPRETL